MILHACYIFIYKMIHICCAFKVLNFESRNIVPHYCSASLAVKSTIDRHPHSLTPTPLADPTMHNKYNKEIYMG